MEAKYFNEDAFRKIDKEKLEIISKLFNDLNNKNANERLEVLFTYAMEMNSRGLSFTKDESALLIELLKMNLSDAEKAKIEVITNMMKNIR